MKKIFAIVLIMLLAVCGSGALIASASTVQTAAPSAKAAEQGKLYLVPGTYVSGGVKAENTVSSGAQKLTQEQCAEIFTDNAYLCSLAQGETLPTPSTDRKDKEGNPYAFNGWWSISDAAVTYYDKVPAVTKTTFLYADWRADLSQRKDPVIPDGNTPVQVKHYMTIKRASGGETETVTLRVGGTDMTNAATLGYGAPVQLYNDWFELSKGDVITVYTVGLDNSETPKVTPILINDYREIALESSGDGSNVTANYLTAYAPVSKRQTPSLTCIAETSRHYRIYIKFYSGGSTMAVYMEPMD